MLSYGVFASTKKIFSYEREGVHTLPIFTNAETADRFSKIMTKILKKEFKDKRVLHTQICDTHQHALDIFQAIVVYAPDLMKVVIDPQPPLQTNDPSDICVIENVRDIDEVIEDIQQSIAAPQN